MEVANGEGVKRQRSAQDDAGQLSSTKKRKKSKKKSSRVVREVDVPVEPVAKKNGASNAEDSTDDDVRPAVAETAQKEGFSSAECLIPPTPSLAAEVEWETFNIEKPPDRQNVNCIHELVKPKGYVSPTLRKDLEPAKKYDLSF